MSTESSKVSTSIFQTPFPDEEFKNLSNLVVEIFIPSIESESKATEVSRTPLPKVIGILICPSLSDNPTNLGSIEETRSFIKILLRNCIRFDGTISNATTLIFLFLAATQREKTSVGSYIKKMLCLRRKVDG